MSLIPGVTRRDINTTNVIGQGKRAFMGTEISSRHMNPPTPQEYGRLSGTNSDGTSSTVACWGGAGSNQSSLN